MAEQNIVVVGASYGGILAAHYTAKHIVTNKNLPNLRLVLISPSADFYHQVGGPRAIIDEKLLPDDKVFYNLSEGFNQYPSAAYKIVIGTVSAVDTSARSLRVEAKDGNTQNVPYHALVLATGAPATSPLFSSFPDTDHTRAALAAFRSALPSARSVVIGGGGAVAVEAGGEIGEFLNGRAGCFSSRPSNPKARVTIVTSAKKLLPVLREDVATQAEKYLNKVGVNVVYNTKVVNVSPENAGFTADTVVQEKGKPIQVSLDDGQVIEADIYIPAYGVRSNAGYLPKSLLTVNGRIKTNDKTLRVDEAGPRVYAFGDAASSSPGGIYPLLHMLPVVMTNMKRDLLAATEGQEKRSSGKDREFEVDPRASQILPVGRAKGVGQLFGWWVPSFFVWLIKGRDFLVSITGNYHYGKMVKKEYVWKFE